MVQTAHDFIPVKSVNAHKTRIFKKIICKISPQGRRFLTQSVRTTPISLEDRTEDGDIFTHFTPGLTRLGESYGIVNSLQLLLPRLSSAHSRTFLLTFIHTFIQSQLSHATFSQAQPTRNRSLIHFVLF